MSNAYTGYALIIGGSSGIGYELVCRSIERGYRPIIIACDPQKLVQTRAKLQVKYNVDVAIESVDLRDSASLSDKLTELTTRFSNIELMIYAAGIGFGGEFVGNHINQEQNVLAVNVNALVRANHHFSRCFKQKNSGYILNVASLAGFQPGPYFANYYATKSYVLSFSEALSIEMRRYNVNVSVVCPGTTATGFHERANIQDTDLARGLFGIIMTPEKVSKVAFHGMTRKKRVIVPGFVNKLAAFSVRVTPRRLVATVTALINKDSM